MLILLNSAVMLQDGTYKKKTISSQEAKTTFTNYMNDYKSYIGYPNTCRVLSQLFEKQIELNRDRTIIKHGDIILSISLKYRIDNPAEKKTRIHGNKLEDYNFARITFELE